MKEIEIKKVTPNKIEQLQKFGRQTFAETFSSKNSEENMKEYLNKGFSTEKLKTELSDKNSEFYFAILENKVIGYLKVNFGQSQTENKDENTLEIERIYVLKEFHGKKSDNCFMKRQWRFQSKKVLIMFGWEFWKKIREQSDFIKKMDL